MYSDSNTSNSFFCKENKEAEADADGDDYYLTLTQRKDMIYVSKNTQQNVRIGVKHIKHQPDS